MTYTKQQGCIIFIDEKKNTKKTENTENLAPKIILLDSLERLLTELNDFQKVAEKYFGNIDNTIKKEEV